MNQRGAFCVEKLEFETVKAHKKFCENSHNGYRNYLTVTNRRFIYTLRELCANDSPKNVANAINHLASVIVIVTR